MNAEQFASQRCKMLGMAKLPLRQLFGATCGTDVFSCHLLKMMVLVVALLLTKLASAGPIMSPEELTSFAQGYYLHPQPERIVDAIESISSSGFIQKNAWGFTSFFGEVFATHPDQLPKWEGLIALQDKPTRDFLQHSLDLCHSGGTLAVKGHSPKLNDQHWGAFFASGNPAYIYRLIDELIYFDERKDLNLFMTGATAKWSLLSNLEQHTRVRKIVEAARAAASKRTREIIDTMLRQNAEDVRWEIKEIREQQRAAGIWK